MLERDSEKRDAYANDFSQLNYQKPAGIYFPDSGEHIQQIILDASKAGTSLTIRCQGLSQGGQSVVQEGGYILSVENLKGIDLINDSQVWVGAGNTWEDVLSVCLPEQSAPMALPYNCQLSVGGVLSAGGMGAGAFKYGPMIANVDALDIIDGCGNHALIDHTDERFHAMLGGQGNFGVICRACMALRPVKPLVKTWFLLFDKLDGFFDAIGQARDSYDYIESFCSVSMQGAILKDNQRKPLTHWLYGLHVSLEYEDSEPERAVVETLSPYDILGQQSEPIHQYFLRHNHRFESMRASGQWSLIHPWYECYLDQASLLAVLPDILANISPIIAPFIHIIPIQHKQTGMIMFPDKGPLFSFMILNPGLPHFYTPLAIETLNWLNDVFLKAGGKRYLSGYQGEINHFDWWQQHFGEKLSWWQSCKRKYDPHHVFNSKLFQSIIR